MNLMHFSNQDRELILRWEREERNQIEAARKLKFWHCVSMMIVALEIFGFLYLGWAAG